MKKLLFACMALAGVFALAGCSPQPPSDQEGKAYIRKVLAEQGEAVLKEAFSLVFQNGAYVELPGTENDVYKLDEIVSISDGVRESHYYDSPALLYHVSVKYHEHSASGDVRERTGDLDLAVIKDKKTGKLSLTMKYRDKDSRRW